MGFNPMMQFLHEDDIAEAIVLAHRARACAACSTSSAPARCRCTSAIARGRQHGRCRCPSRRAPGDLARCSAGGLYRVSAARHRFRQVPVHARRHAASATATGFTPRFSLAETFAAVRAVSGRRVAPHRRHERTHGRTSRILDSRAAPRAAPPSATPAAAPAAAAPRRRLPPAPRRRRAAACATCCAELGDELWKQLNPGRGARRSTTRSRRACAACRRAQRVRLRSVGAERRRHAPGAGHHHPALPLLLPRRDLRHRQHSRRPRAGDLQPRRPGGARRGDDRHRHRARTRAAAHRARHGRVLAADGPVREPADEPHRVGGRHAEELHRPAATTAKP